MKIFVLLLLLFFTVVTLSHAKHKKKTKKNDTFLIADDFCVKVKGKSGKIELMRVTGAEKKRGKKKKPCEDKNKITVDFDKFQELNQLGQPVVEGGRSDNWFKNVAFNVGTPARVTYQNLGAYKVSLTLLINGANFAVDVYLFTDTGKITYANMTQEVTKGQMKFTIKIDNWTFCGDPTRPLCSQGQFLQLKLKIKGKKKKGKKNKASSGDGIFDVPLGTKDKVFYFNKVMVDGKFVKMTTNYPELKSKKKGKEYEFTLRFPRGKNISYDPIIEISEEGDSSDFP